MNDEALHLALSPAIYADATHLTVNDGSHVTAVVLKLRNADMGGFASVLTPAAALHLGQLLQKHGQAAAMHYAHGDRDITGGQCYTDTGCRHPDVAPDPLRC